MGNLSTVAAIELAKFVPSLQRYGDHTFFSWRNDSEGHLVYDCMTFWFVVPEVAMPYWRERSSRPS